MTRNMLDETDLPQCLAWLLKDADGSRPGSDSFPSDTYYRFNLDSTYDTLALVPDQEKSHKHSLACCIRTVRRDP